MYCSRSANNKINKPRERALRLVYDDYNSTFEKILSNDGSFTINHQNIQKLEKFTMDFHKSLFQISFMLIIEQNL